MRPEPRSPIATAIAIATLLVNLLAGALPAGATARTWVNAAGGSAGTASNWSPAGVPAAADNLLFNLASTYTVDFPAGVPQVVSHAYNGGFVTVTTSSPHVCTSSWAVGNLGTGVLTSSGADLTAGTLAMGLASTNYGRFTITVSGGIPAVPSHFQTSDSTQSSIVAGDGKARLEVFGGSQASFGNNVILGNTSTSRCTLSVAGRSALTFSGSGFVTSNPRRSFLGGLGGQAQISVSNGGFMHIAGQASLGPSGTGVGNLTVGGTTFNASAQFDGPLYVGGNQFNGTAGGTGSLVVGSRGFVDVAGPLQVGDPDGGGTSSLAVTGGELIAAGGLTIAANGGFAPNAGLTQIIGGTFTPKPNGGLAIGISGVTGDSAVVRIANQQANGYVNHFDGILVGGTSAPGTLVVTGAGTTFGATSAGACYIGAWFGIPGYLVVDSLATFEPGGPFGIGTGGPGTATISGGSQVHAGPTTVGASTTGDATLIVKGAGTQMTFIDQLADGGASAVAGANSNVLADSGATISGVLGANAGTAVVVQGPQGHALASNGGTIGADTVRVIGTADTRDGIYAAGLVTVDASGAFGGHGDVTGSLANAGTVHATGPIGVFRALRVGGAYSQGVAARLRIRLGKSGGPASDTLAVGGSVGLNGILALEADPTFIRTVGDSFTVVTYGSRLGSFAGLTWNGNPGLLLFDLVYEPHKLVVVVKNATDDVAPSAPSALRFAVLDNGARPDLALDLPAAAHARVDLFDVNGRRAALVHDGDLAAGRHTFSLDPARRSVAPGVYFARATIGREGWSRTVRVVVVR